MALPFELSALGPIFAAGGVIAGPILYGLALSVLSFSQFAYQREVLKGENPNTAIAVGYSNILSSSVLFATLAAASPLLGPVAPFIPALWFASMTLSVVSALSAGGYEKLSHDWKQSGFRPLKAIISVIDTGLWLIPGPLKRVSGNFFAGLHNWLGTFYFAAQVVLFGGIAGLISPALGAAGLAFFGLSYLRAKNYLPQFVSYGLERFSFWMGLLSGLFIPNPVLKLYTYYSIASAFVVKFALPRVNRWFFGAKPESKATNQADVTEKPQVVARKLTLAKFKQLMADKFPKPITREADKMQDGLPGDLERLGEEYKEFKIMHYKARLAAYSEFKALQSAPRFVDRAKYYLGVVPMNVAWYLRSVFNYPMRPKQFLRFKDTQNAFGLNLTRIGVVPKIDVPAAELSFDEFLTEVSKYVDGNGNGNDNFKSMISASLNGSPKFKVGNLKEEIEDLEAEDRSLQRALAHMAPMKDDSYTEMMTRLTASNFSPAQYKAGQEQVIRKYATTKTINNKGLIARLKSFLTRLGILSKHSTERTQPVINRDELTEAMQTRLAACKVELKAKQDELATSWVSKLGLPADANEEEVYIAFFKYQLADICKQVQSGGVAWDKSIHSVKVWQEETKRVFAQILRLLKSGDEAQIGTALEQLNHIVVDTAEYCAKALYDIMHELHQKSVVTEHVANSNLSAKDLLALNLHKYLTSSFDTFYNVFKEQKLVKALFFHLDFTDRHDKGYIKKALKYLNLDDAENLNSDLSNESTDLLKEVSAGIIANSIASLLRTCEQSYSINGILHDLYVQIVSPQQSLCPKEYGAAICLGKWIAEFDDQQLKDHLIGIIEDARNNKCPETERALKQVLALMLIDCDVFKFNKESTKEAVQEILAKPDAEICLDSAPTPTPSLGSTPPLLAFSSGLTSRSATSSPNSLSVTTSSSDDERTPDARESPQFTKLKDLYKLRCAG